MIEWLIFIWAICGIAWHCDAQCDGDDLHIDIKIPMDDPIRISASGPLVWMIAIWFWTN